MILFRILVCVLLFSGTACNQKERKPILIMNASVHQGNGELIENAALAFKDDKITLLADARIIRLDMTAFQVIDAFGMHIYPAVVEENIPPALSSDHAYYAARLEGTSALILTGDSLTADSPLPILQEGEEASFVVTDQALDTEEVNIRYLVEKGRLEEKNHVSLQQLGKEN